MKKDSFHFLALWCIVGLIDSLQATLRGHGLWGNEPYWIMAPWYGAMRVYGAGFLISLPLCLLLRGTSRNSLGKAWMALPVVLLAVLATMRLPLSNLIRVVMCASVAMVLFPCCAWILRRIRGCCRGAVNTFCSVVILACLAILLLGAVWTVFLERKGVVPGSHALPNVVLISLDTLRPDRLGCYGADRPNSPVIDSLALQSVLFENAYAQAPYTLPSHVSLLTSLYPDAHGVLVERSRLSEEVLTLAEVLRFEGYNAVAFVDSDPEFFLGASYGLNQGFQYYGHFPENLTADGGLLLRSFLADCKENLFPRQWDRSGRIASAAATWIRRSRSEPFFLFLHLFAVHAEEEGYPYHPYPVREESAYPSPLPEGIYSLEGKSGAQYLKNMVRPSHRENISPGLVESLLGLYDRGVQYVDDQVGTVTEALKQRGVWDSAIVILTSDHGEQFYESGGFLHHDLYEEVMRIPILLKPAEPNPTGVRIQRIVQSIDIAPTICELVGISVPRNFQGRSLLQVDRQGEAYAVAGYLDNVALWKGDWKLWRKDGSPSWEGPHLPKEEAHIVQNEMESLLHSVREKSWEHYETYRSEKENPISPRQMERLRGLGYVD